jgi:hypothetical protein
MVRAYVVRRGEIIPMYTYLLASVCPFWSKAFKFW